MEIVIQITMQTTRCVNDIKFESQTSMEALGEYSFFKCEIVYEHHNVSIPEEAVLVA